MGEGLSVYDVYDVFKGTVLKVADEVVGWRESGREKKETHGTDEIRDAEERKKKAYKKMLQRNLPEEVKARRKSAYKEWKKKVRELIEESKRRVDEEFGRKLRQNFCENKKLFWKEVKKVRERRKGVKEWED